MKELSIEEKAELYDEIMHRAKKELDSCGSQDCDAARQIFRFFPELKESEDERIRKNLIELFHDTVSNDEIFSDYGLDKTEVLAWLEKQGEQQAKLVDFDFNANDSDLQEVTYFIPKGFHAKIIGDKVVIKLGEQNPQGKSALEAIKEEKVDNANKVEPKFKIGDWVVGNINKVRFLLKSFNSGFCTLEDTEGRIYSPCEPPNEVDYHLWTIQDAKDGDILRSTSHHLIWIYKDNESYHACVNMNYVTENVATNGLISVPNDACPATKDARTILFAMLRKSGYTFDFEKKELKKIEQKKQEKRCRNCVHMIPLPNCPWLTVCDTRTWGKKVKRNYSVKPSTKACELFENKNNK